MDRQWLGNFVLASQRLYPGMYHGTGIHGRVTAGIPETQLQNHRAQRGPGEQSQQVGCGHRGDSGPQGEISGWLEGAEAVPAHCAAAEVVHDVQTEERLPACPPRRAGRLASLGMT